MKNTIKEEKPSRAEYFEKILKYIAEEPVIYNGREPTTSSLREIARRALSEAIQNELK